MQHQKVIYKVMIYQDICIMCMVGVWDLGVYWSQYYLHMQSLQWLSFFRLACGSSSSESETRHCMY